MLSDTQLWEAAHEAGHSLFQDRLSFFTPADLTVERSRLSDLQALDPEENYIDERGFVFFPNRGGGLDVSSHTWLEADPSWVDTDGNIYTAWADGIIRVVQVDVSLTET